MKRTVSCLLIAACCCLMLCGCGAGDERLDEMVVGTPIIPETSPIVTPMPTPDVEDGVVKDGDGLIEDGDTGRVKAPEASKRPDAATENQTDNRTTVPSPEVSAKP